MARISPGLSPSEVSGLFPVLYPSQGCSPMHELFLVSYREELEITFALVAIRQAPQYVA